MKHQYVMCENCHEIFTIEARKGRPPLFCKECEDKKESPDELKRKLAKERIDRLEMLLRSTGSHISQHRKDYD